MDIKKLDINQCPGDYFTPNAFKRTHKCDDKTSYVSIYKYSKNWISFINISFPVCANSRQRFQDWRLQMHVQTRIWISFWGSYWLLWRTEVGCRVPEPGGGQTQLVRHVQMSSCWCLWPLILHHHHGVCCHPLHLPQTRPPQIEKKPETYSAVTHLRY